MYMMYMHVCVRESVYIYIYVRICTNTYTWTSGVRLMRAVKVTFMFTFIK